MELATFGGGCFWCLEAVFQRLSGVEKIVSGYTGGFNPNPTYKEVCSGSSGHAEVIQISFDPTIISFEELVEFFFIFHDPTTLNRQGNDVGTQYRSVIYYHNAEQLETIDKYVQGRAQELWHDPIVTEISPLGEFYPGEAYHQNYYNQNTTKGYCAYVIGPKVGKLKAKYLDKLKTEYQNG